MKSPSWLRLRSPLLAPAVLLSAASLAWTTWSLVDLLGTGHIGVTVAAGADIIWAAVIVAEARRLRLPLPWGKHRNLVPAIGWAALLTVAALLVWHGLRADSMPMAVAGPLLPLGAKVVWLLALADLRDPAALTPEEQQALAELERGMAFEEAQHRIEMRRREMSAEQLLAGVSLDFEIELTRQEKGRELHRRRPLELPTTPGSHEVAEQANDVIAEHEHTPPNTTNTAPNKPNIIREQIANKAATSTNADREQPTIADLVREQVAATEDNATAVRRVLAIIPDANKSSVAAAVRRERRRLGEGFYP
ncbi:hypothetical protein [Streptomyces sp. WMMC897]|uniref:hypothetical protein n=1 Tax=Streptomyces sp. WMMC897 TaxID=3014782 RepID=UPI0022B696CF|nr:hypothetical protein [Streptomyces sp. WMMC897]MCZ7413057.1 hypothetical protein [Streptomyces sp. WMMC897]MCZ7413145.1 hypothetical protein [Streptomyces sp. WMMC897]MCZ7415471.1 hypothetical protein [Streptomyces sp. WMMC897]